MKFQVDNIIVNIKGIEASKSSEDDLNKLANTMKKAIIYARVSTKEQEKEGFSIPAQIKLLNDYALKNDINIVREYTDSETLQKRIDETYIDKLDGTITNEFWQEKNALWHQQKDELIDKLKILNNSDRKFFESSNHILQFCNDAHSWFLRGNAEQKRNIINLACSNLSYKDKELSIELSSVFNCIAETAILINGSPGWTKLELLANNILSFVESKESANVLHLLGRLKGIA